MAVYDHEEQEQLAKIKAWWADYGHFVTGVLVVLTLALVGWQGWHWHTRQQHTEASSLFTGVQQAAQSENAVKAREGAGLLISQHPSTLYAQLGALLSAHAQVKAGEAENARTQLVWAMEQGKDPALRDLARLRLAALELNENQFEKALALLNAPHDPSFSARFTELSGDIHLAQGKHDEARKAYAKARDALSPQAAQGMGRELLELKQLMAGGEG
jgi:predicted negative regulator of RcsB-dependent stress response